MTPPTLEKFIQSRNWHKVLYCYGINALLKVLEVKEQAEAFEDCRDIKALIERHNHLVNDNLPTK